MKIHFYLADQNPHRDRTLGISQYTLQLMAHLQRQDGTELSCLASRSSIRPDGALIPTQVLPFRTDRLAGRLLADQLHPWIKAPASDLVHYPKGYLPLWGRRRSPIVATIHDTIVDYYEQHYPRSRPRAAFGYWRTVLSRSLTQVDLVLTISQFSKRSIEAFCQRHGIACPRIVVTYQGARWAARPGVPARKGDDVVHLSSTAQHKRTVTLLEYWAQLQREGRSLPRLCLIGEIDETARRRFGALPNVDVLGRLTSSELRERLAAARAVVIPSEVEGFGLPALEGYYLGTPAVYVRGTAIEELLGPDTPGGFQLDSVESFWMALTEVLELDRRWVSAKARQLADRFAWVRCAERTLAAYRSL